MRIVPLLLTVLLIWPHTAAAREVSDALGRKVVIPETVERVICSGSGCLRLLTYLRPMLGWFAVSLIGFVIFASAQPMLAGVLKYFVDGLTLPAGGLMAAAVGVIVGVPSLRIKGLYLAIATLAAQLIIEWIINHVPAISGGSPPRTASSAGWD